MTFCEVTEQNKSALLQMKVKSSQKTFIETVRESLLEAEDDARWHPLGIYENGKPVGFTMYGLFNEEGGRLWLDRLLIDRHYQGEGLGKKALTLLLRQLRASYPKHNIYLSVFEENVKAIALYKSFGFTFNGERDYKGERVMVLNQDAPAG